MNAHDAHQLLDQIQRALRAHGEVLLADRLRDELLDDDFTLTLTPGQRSPLTVAKQDAYGAALRSYAENFLSGLSARERAGRLVSALDHYFSTGWKRRRGDAKCPHSLDEPEYFLWQALRAKPKLIRERQMRSILGGQ